MSSLRFAPRGTTLALLTLALGVGACKDAIGPKEHPEPVGLLVESGGIDVVTVAADRTVSGTFTVAAGQNTGLLNVTFFDEDGLPIVLDDDEYLRVEIASSAVATLLQTPGGASVIQFAGVAPGTTTVRLSLVHGEYPGGHADYTSPNITLTVTP